MDEEESESRVEGRRLVRKKIRVVINAERAVTLLQVELVYSDVTGGKSKS